VSTLNAADPGASFVVGSLADLPDVDRRALDGYLKASAPRGLYEQFVEAGTTSVSSSKLLLKIKEMGVGDYESVKA